MREKPGKTKLLVTIGNAPTIKVIGRQLHRNLIAGKDTDIMHTHLSRNVSQHHVPVLQFYPEHGVGQRLRDDALKLNGILFSQKQLLSNLVIKIQQTMLP